MLDLRAAVRGRLAAARLEPSREHEIVEELAQHLEDRYRELVAGGATPAAAEAATLAELDDHATLTRELARALPPPRVELVPGEGGGHLLAALGHDLRYAARSLRKNVGFTLVTILSLALGIGANTTMFQLLDAIHLRPLPVAHPEELASVNFKDRHWGKGSFNSWHSDLTYPLWEQLRERQEAFSGVIAWADRDLDLATSGESRPAHLLLVSGNYFDVLGVHPLLGRLFTDADDRRGCAENGVVVSAGFWQRELGGDPAAIGHRLTVDGHAVQVIGVTPPEFFGLEVGRVFDVATPLCMDATLRGKYNLLDRKDGWWLSAAGRLKPGWTLDRASAQLATISPQLLDATIPSSYLPEEVEKYRAFRLEATSGANGISELRKNYSTPLYFLLGTAALVLLIACANLASLLLARASTREREIAVRLALGASRGRLIRQLIAESLLVAILGAAAAVLLAGELSQLLLAYLSTSSHVLSVDVSLDLRTLGFTAGVAGLTVLLFGLAPALHASRTDVALVLKTGAGHSAPAGRRLGLRQVLVIAQIAMSFVLLVGALLFARSFRNLSTTDPGFRSDGVIVASVDYTKLGFPVERMVPFQAELLERVRATPGVISAASTSIVPISGNGWNENVWRADLPTRETFTSNFSRVSPGYGATLGIRLLAGRDFDARDGAASAPVVLVNEQLAKKLTSGAGSPIGLHLRVEVDPGAPELDYEVVGEVSDAKYGSLREDPTPTAFVAAAQDKDPFAYAQFLVRGAVDTPPRVVIAGLKHTLADAAPDALFSFDVLSSSLSETLTGERVMATLSTGFGLLAALLVAIGLYGVVSYSVARRTHEIGIRMALGADRRRVTFMVLREALIMTGVGAAIGLAVSFVAMRAIASLLYGLAPSDPSTMAFAMLFMLLVTVVASYLPARRAASVDPMIALRDQ